MFVVAYHLVAGMKYSTLEVRMVKVNRMKNYLPFGEKQSLGKHLGFGG